VPLYCKFHPTGLGEIWREREPFYPTQRISWRLYKACCILCLETLQSLFSNVSTLRYSSSVDSFRISTSIRSETSYEYSPLGATDFDCLPPLPSSPKTPHQHLQQLPPKSSLLYVFILRKVRIFSCAYRSWSRSSTIVQLDLSGCVSSAQFKRPLIDTKFKVRAFSYLPKRLSAADRRSPHRSE
jgi:hypothetical protein